MSESRLQTSARLAIEIADHHLCGATVEKRRDLARAILNAISICERELADAMLATIPALIAANQPSQRETR